MSINSNIDIGICVTKTSEPVERILCLDNDLENFCCVLPNSSVLIQDTGQRACCKLEEYLDLQWATLGSIQGFLILLTIVFVLLLVTCVWIFITSCRIRESEVVKSRKEIIRHLFREQMLHKSRLAAPSAYDSLKNLTRSVSSSRKRRNKPKKREDSDTPKSPKNRLRVRWDNANVYR